MLKKLFAVLSLQDKRFFYALLAFSVLISFIESFAISLIMPFVSVASDFSLFERNAYLRQIDEFFSLPKYELVAYFGLLRACFYRSSAHLAKAKRHTHGISDDFAFRASPLPPYAKRKPHHHKLPRPFVL